MAMNATRHAFAISTSLHQYSVGSFLGRIGRFDVTFCDCRLVGGAGSIVDDSKIGLMHDPETSREKA